MDYPLHYSTENDSNNNSNENGNHNYRNYSVFNDRSEIMLYDNINNSNNNNNNNSNHNASTSPKMEHNLELKQQQQQQNRSRSVLLMSTRPNIMHDPWNTSSSSSTVFQQQQHHHHSLNTNGFSQAMAHNLHHNFPQAERGIAGFVSKLYQCLNSTDTSQKYARWCHHEGKDMFIIDCIPEFTEIVLPRLFKHCKFPSFVRQLNIYGFQRDTDARKSKDTKDKESCRWYHPCFRPGRRDLFHLIRRKATRYSRKKRVKAEEDPETILNLGSGDESDINNDEVLIVNQDESNHPTTTTTTSSVIIQQPIEYNTHHIYTPREESLDNTEDIISNSNTILDNTNVLHEQDLRLQLYQMKRHYEKMQGYFEEQLNTAHIQIDEQRLHIQQLEETLRFTKNTNGYITTNYNNNNYRLQRSLFTNDVSTPRPTNNSNQENHFYFPANDSSKIVQIKTENDNNNTTTTTTTTTSSNWSTLNHHHRDTFDKTNHGIVAAGSNTTEPTTSSIIDNHNHRTTDSTTATTATTPTIAASKSTLPLHMNYTPYM